ncbi:MAG: porphobilinogen synthase [Deltaproteobacteria bacterium]|nr:porphobilinogen synthase [Deltaproteobacteria bacterium]
MTYPIHRGRRLRRTKGLRSLVCETRLSADQFVMPLFVCPGTKVRNPIRSMPGNFQLSVDELVEDCKKLMDDGIGHVILFGIPETKDAIGSSGYADDGIIPTAIRALKKDVKDLMVWGDVCMCEYTDHGHCGVIKDGDVDNDETLELLIKASLAYAQAGADVVAPSDMMDGRVGAIRDALDERGLEKIVIVSYAAKYASGFYGPFRDAAESPPQFGDRKSYQMDPPNVLEALREVEMDLEEGADIVMVKPALPYLDVIRRVKEDFEVPVAAYNVSGEFSMLHAAAQNGWLDLETVMMESLVGIKRAGADIILTYFARDAAKLLAK